MPTKHLLVLTIIAVHSVQRTALLANTQFDAERLLPCRGVIGRCHEASILLIAPGIQFL